MRSEKDFLSISNIAFPNCVDIKKINQIPIIYQSVCEVFCLEQKDNANYVICFDENKYFQEVLMLYGALRKKYPRTFIYITKDFANSERKKYSLLIFKHISFVDYVGGLYYYNATFDNLEEVSHDLNNDSDYGYTKNTQLVFKYYLFNPVKSYTVRVVADYLKISPASVSRANESLYSLGVLTKKGYGNNLEYKIINKRDALSKLEKHFIKPFDHKYFIYANDEEFSFIASHPLSGDNALSLYTDLLPYSKIETYAMLKKEFEQFYNPDCSFSLNDNMHYVAVQTYIYDPRLFSNGAVIDLFDLYVTLLRESLLDDPRVHDVFINVKELLLNEK